MNMTQLQDQELEITKATADTLLSLSDEEFSSLQIELLNKMDLTALWAYMANRSIDEDQIDDAQYAAKRSFTLGDDKIAGLFIMANIKLHARDFHAAKRLFKDTIEDPRYTQDAIKGAYICAIELKAYKEARHYAAQMVEEDPKDAEKWDMLFTALSYLDDSKGLIDACVERLQKNHRYDQTACEKLWSTVSFFIPETGTSKDQTEHDEKVKEVRDAVSSAPEHIQELMEVVIAFKKGDKDMAVAMSEKFAAQYKHITPLNIIATLLHHSAVLHYEESRYPEALNAIEKVLNKLPTHKSMSSDLLNMEGLCEYRIGNYTAARECWASGMRTYPEQNIFYINFLEGCRKTDTTEGVLEAGLKLARLNMETAEKEANPGITIQDPAGTSEPVYIPASSIAPRDKNEPLFTPANIGKPSLPTLIESSIDLKLTEDGRVKIIETNDLYASGFEGFKRAYGKNMHEDYVLPYHEHLERELREKHDKNALVLRPQSRQSLPYLVQAFMQAQNAVFTSAALPWKAVNHRKDYLHLTTPKKWEDIYPRTIIVPRSEKLSAGELKKRLQRLLDDGQDMAHTNFIMKPCADSIGRGVELVSGADIVTELHKVTSWSSPEGSYWYGQVDPNVVVQECIRSKPVQADNGKFYDGTMRIAFTATIAPDGKSVEDVKFYRPYWKLPANPYDDEDTRNSVVSFPPSSLKKPENEGKDIPVSARVSYTDQWNVEHQLRPYLEDVLPRYTLSAEDYAAQLSRFASSRSDAKRSIAVDLSTYFTHAAAIGIIAGNRAANELNETIRSARWSSKSAAAHYREYLFDKPVESAKHALALASRSQAMLEQRLALQPNEVRLEPEDWLDDVHVDVPKPQIIKII